MEIEESKRILLLLANGINPITDEELDDNDLYNNPLIIRALFTIIYDKGEFNSKKKISNVKIAAKQRVNTQNGQPKNNGFPWRIMGYI